jgi:hypothetical protein
MGSASELRVEVVYAASSRQAVKTLRLPAGSSVEDAIRASGLLAEFPEIDLARRRVGIFGELTELATPLADGDRVEIYRALLADPKETRRRRARPRKTG